LQENAEALNRFLRLFYSQNGGPDEAIRLGHGEMLGPISVVERPVAGLPALTSEIPLFIGKVRTDCLAGEATSQTSAGTLVPDIVPKAVNRCFLD